MFVMHCLHRSDIRVKTMHQQFDTQYLLRHWPIVTPLAPSNAATFHSCPGIIWDVVMAPPTASVSQMLPPIAAAIVRRYVIIISLNNDEVLNMLQQEQQFYLSKCRVQKWRKNTCSKVAQWRVEKRAKTAHLTVFCTWHSHCCCTAFWVLVCTASVNRSRRYGAF